MTNYTGSSGSRSRSRRRSRRWGGRWGGCWGECWVYKEKACFAEGTAHAKSSNTRVRRTWLLESESLIPAVLEVLYRPREAFDLLLQVETTYGTFWTPSPPASERDVNAFPSWLAFSNITNHAGSFLNRDSCWLWSGLWIYKGNASSAEGTAHAKSSNTRVRWAWLLESERFLPAVLEVLYRPREAFDLLLQVETTYGIFRAPSSPASGKDINAFPRWRASSIVADYTSPFIGCHWTWRKEKRISERVCLGVEHL